MMGMATPLSPQDMHDIGAYFASKNPLPGVADQALVDQGQTLFREGDTTRGIPACMACHSIDGRGNPGAMYPQLTSQHAQYIQATLKSWHDGTTWGDDAHSQIMPSIAQKLTRTTSPRWPAISKACTRNEPDAPRDTLIDQRIAGPFGPVLV
jgi:cytochrome c553